MEHYPPILTMARNHEKSLIKIANPMDYGRNGMKMDNSSQKKDIKMESVMANALAGMKMA